MSGGEANRPIVGTARRTKLAVLPVFTSIAWFLAAMPQTAKAIDVGTSPEVRPKDDYLAALLEFESNLKRAAGEKAVDCGLSLLGHEPNDIVSCGAKQLSERTAFWLAIEIGDLDTTTWRGLVRNGEGDLFLFEARADPWNYRWALAHPSVARCRSVTLDPNATDRRDRLTCASKREQEHR